MSNVKDNAERIIAKTLESALSELLEQIECLGGIELCRDIEPYKAEAVWNDVISRAQDAIRQARIVL